MSSEMDESRQEFSEKVKDFYKKKYRQAYVDNRNKDKHLLDKFKLQIQELEYQNEENKSKHNRLQKNSKSRIQALEDQLRLKKSTEKQEKHFDWTNFNKICYLCGNKFDKGGHQRVILVSCGDQFGQSCLAGMHAAGDHQCPTCSHVFRARDIKSMKEIRRLFV